MSETKFTPGPWTFQYERSGFEIFTPKRTVAEHKCMDARLDPSVEADARLIAAAPEMHEALLNADAQIEYLHSKFKPTGSGNAVLSIIRAALAKADGRS